MRLVCFFDVPSVTEKEKKEAQRFREFLLKKGFVMMQWSMYAKHLLYNDSLESLSNSIKNRLPENGNLMLIEMTDKQFENLLIYNNFQRTKPPKKYETIELF